METKECTNCFGFGLWAIGLSSPMGPMDASGGLPTLPCPECGANANPVEDDDEEPEDSQ